MLNYNHINAVGIDEVGRGALAGPVVAAAVVLPEKSFIEGLSDSKQLTAKKRLALEPIIKSCSVGWAIGAASVEEIDRHNILQATFLAMHRALDHLRAKGVEPSLLLVDGHRFKPYHTYPYRCIVGGDRKEASIAAASVLAKVYRDELISGYAVHVPGYGWARHAGYGTKHHREAIKRLGRTVHHRKSFRVKGIDK